MRHGRVGMNTDIYLLYLPASRDLTVSRGTVSLVATCDQNTLLESVAVCQFHYYRSHISLYCCSFQCPDFPQSLTPQKTVEIWREMKYLALYLQRAAKIQLLSSYKHSFFSTCLQTTKQGCQRSQSTPGCCSRCGRAIFPDICLMKLKFAQHLVVTLRDETDGGE